MKSLIFNFRKEIPNNYYHTEDGVKNLTGIYYFFSGDNTIGKFVCAGKSSVFLCEGQTFGVEKKWGWLKSYYYLTNKKNGIIIGEYEFNNWHISRKVISKFILAENEVYEFTRLPSPVKYHIFKRSTWGYFQFKLSNNKESVVYNFRIDSSVIGGGLSENALAGTAELINSDKTYLAFAGIYLLEEYFLED